MIGEASLSQPQAAPMAAALSSHEPRRRDRAAARLRILRRAADVFAEHGREGASMGLIGDAIGCGKRMLYHYFDSKEELYDEVLSIAQHAVLASAPASDLDALPPKEALAKLVGDIFDAHLANPSFTRLLAGEIAHAREPGRLPELRGANSIDAVRRILRRGAATGAFRPGVDPLDLHLSISALCMFSASSRDALALVLGDSAIETAAAGRRASVIHTIVSAVAASAA